MSMHRFIPLMLLLPILSNCGIETAKPATQPLVTLASDCLKNKELFLINSFTRESGIRVRIIHLTASEIEKKLKREKTNSDIDAVLLMSSYDALHLENEKLLQKIPSEQFPLEFNIKFSSEKRSVIGLGFDPYVIVRRPEAARLKNYTSLLNCSGYCTDLRSHSALAPFYLFIFRKLGGSNFSRAKHWITDFHRTRVKFLAARDTLIYAQLLFTKRSSFELKKNSALQSYALGDLIYPNQRIGGAYYDMPCFGIIKQAPNFSHAVTLMHHLLSRNGNLSLNKQLQTVAYHNRYKATRFKRYQTSPLRMGKYLNEVRIYLKKAGHP